MARGLDLVVAEPPNGDHRARRYRFVDPDAGLALEMSCDDEGVRIFDAVPASPGP